jgi:hypothetical protein
MANTRPIYLTKKFRVGKGTARYPAIATPDTKFKEEGEYTCDMILPDEASLARVKKAYAAAKAEWANLVGAKGKKVADVPWDEQDDGTFRVRLRRLATTKKGTKTRVKVVDPSGIPLTGEDAEFGHGSIIDVGFSARAWHTPTLGYGVSFMPDVVVLYEARFEGGGNLDEYGFDLDGEEADGEEIEDADTPPFETEDGDDSEEDL